MTDWAQRIETALGKHGRQWIPLKAGDGELFFLPHAARLLACRMPEVDGNVFWHHPDLEDPEKAGANLTSAGGGLGGDRLWIAPEVAYMWPDLDKARVDPHGSYDLPAYMDPGHWRMIDRQPDRLTMQTEMTLVDHRSEARVHLDVQRQIRIIMRPTGLPRGVNCASVVIRNGLRILDGDEGAIAGLWDLLQAPVGGRIVCPTAQPLNEAPRSYYEPYREGDVVTDAASGVVTFHAKGDYMIKMGLAPEQTTGRMANIRTVGDQMVAIVRVFSPAPGMPYVDVPRDSNERFGGDALQCFCDDGRFGGFCELEHHEPALVLGCTPMEHEGMVLTYVLSGASEPVLEAASGLLGVSAV